MLTPSLVFHCRCCHCQLEALYQPHWNPLVSGTYLLTCKNPNCAIANQTFDERDYATVDLNRYVVSRAVAGAGQAQR